MKNTHLFSVIALFRVLASLLYGTWNVAFRSTPTPVDYSVMTSWSPGKNSPRDGRHNLVEWAGQMVGIPPEPILQHPPFIGHVPSPGGQP